MSFFFFYKIREQEDRTGPVGGLVPVGVGRMWGNDIGGLNIVQTLCTHVCKWNQMRSVETTPGMRREWAKGEWWRGWIQVWYSWYIVRTSAMYP
jgi:hypothetical protein